MIFLEGFVNVFRLLWGALKPLSFTGCGDPSIRRVAATQGEREFLSATKNLVGFK
jgi:hypothetical protein